VLLSEVKMMSRFFSNKYKELKPYTPGEQPQDQKYVKLNTNESPFPPSPLAVEYAKREAEKLNLYSDPTCKPLCEELAKTYDLKPENVICTNGSDEVLDFVFKCYCDDDIPVAFPNISYGFYPVYAKANRVPFVEIPLKNDFTIDVNDYLGINKTIIIANPNAPTGIALELSDIENIVKSNPDNIIVIDEAYVAFGADSAVDLVKKYDNLIVIGTYSKAMSLAGARLGFAFADEKLISDLNTLRYSTNPYNVNRMTMFAGIGALQDAEYTKKNLETIIENREYTVNELEKLGFEILTSKANFIFAKSSKIDGKELYLELKKRGVLVRHFTKEQISNFVRITIGTKEQMDILLQKIKEVLS